MAQQKAKRNADGKGNYTRKGRTPAEQAIQDSSSIDIMTVDALSVEEQTSIYITEAIQDGELPDDAPSISHATTEFDYSTMLKEVTAQKEQAIQTFDSTELLRAQMTADKVLKTIDRTFLRKNGN
jgi:hypothetical protein